MTDLAQELAVVEDGIDKTGLPPADCTNHCGYGQCDCSGEWRLTNRAVQAHNALALIKSELARLERIEEAARDPFLVILETHPQAEQPANAEMSRAAKRFREALAAEEGGDRE